MTETRPFGEVTLLEKVTFFGVLAKVFCVGLYSALTGPFRGEEGAPTYAKHVFYNCIKTSINNLNFYQTQYMNGSSLDVYLNFAKELGYKVDIVAVTEDLKAFWVGDKTATKVLVYYHGGGYVNAMIEAHIRYLADLQRRMQAQGHEFAIFIPGYVLSPQEPWPKQLQQAAESVNYLIERVGKAPENILIGGDSAGGNLAIALCSHVLHPREKVPPLSLTAPLAGAVLISPWTSFDVTTPAYRQNAATDYMHEILLKYASDKLTASEGTEWYNEPALADVEWWKDLSTVVKDIVVWGGGGELLIDGIETFAAKVNKAHPRVTFLVSPRSCHIEPIMDYLFKTEPTKESKQLEDWIEARL